MPRTGTNVKGTNALACTQQTLKVKQGDLQLPVPLTLLDDAGAPVDLTEALSVKVNIRPVDAAAFTVTARPCNVDNAVAGEISFQWDTGDTSNPGLYLAELQVEWVSGEPQTYPGTGFIEIYIEPDLQETPARSVARVRLEAAAATSQDPVLDAATVAGILDRARLADTSGRAPGDTGWVETYDVAAAAIEAWETKAAIAACRVDVEAAGVKSARSKVHENCLRMAATIRRRRTGSATMVGPNGDPTVAALPIANSDWEPDDTLTPGAGGRLRTGVPW